MIRDLIIWFATLCVCVAIVLYRRPTRREVLALVAVVSFCWVMLG